MGGGEVEQAAAAALLEGLAGGGLGFGDGDSDVVDTDETSGTETGDEDDDSSLLLDGGFDVFLSAAIPTSGLNGATPPI